MEKTLRTDTWEEILLNCNFFWYGQFWGEGKSDLRQYPFSWTKMIYGVNFYLASYPEIFITAKGPKGLKRLVIPTINTWWLFRCHFPHNSSRLLCREKVYNLPSTGQGGQLASRLLSKPPPPLHSPSPLWEVLAWLGWTVKSFTVSGFFLFVLIFFPLMKKHNHSIPGLCSDCTFSWGHPPMLLEKSVFKVTSHFITLSKVVGMQTPRSLLSHIC